MRRLTEVEYDKIFSPETMALLKDKSGESLRQMLGSKDLMTVLRQSQKVLNDIITAEDGYRDELEMVAAQMVTDAYPIIDYANIKIDAKIVGINNLDIPNPPPSEDPTSPDFGEDDPEKLKAKRRIINGITQGASIRGAFGFLLFKEYIDDINPELVGKYNDILKLAFGIYDDENAIAMMLAALAQGQKMQGGESEMEYDEQEEQFVIKAKAICFPMLVHEIVKGLYEIVGTEGFGSDKEKNQAIVGAVDKLSNEPRDLQYGKFIYDAISKLYNESNIDDPRVRELFFAEIYKLTDDEFFPFIENVIANKLQPLQKKWVKDTMNDIASDLGKDDTGLEDLDEGVIDSALQNLRKVLISKKIVKPTDDEAVAFKKAELESWIISQIDNGRLQSRYQDGPQDIVDYAKKLGVPDIDINTATNMLNTTLQDTFNKESIYEVTDMGKVIATIAVLLGTAGAPSAAKAQNPIGNLLKKGVTAVQNKLNPKPKVDTVKVQKDAPLELAKFKDFKGAGYGFASSPNQSTARTQALFKAKADLMQKMGVQRITAGFEEKDTKMYQLPDGTYQCEAVVVIGNM
jgi:hypothetical protein